jgi:DNA-directed RNA polymerase subunit L
MGNKVAKLKVIDYSIRAPYEDEEKTYIRSFSLNDDDPKQILEFYSNYGFVVFRDILNEEEIEKSIDDLWLH